MSHHELTIFFAAIATLLLFARVLGEILAGILLGPTVLGAFAPQSQLHLFPVDGNFPVALQAITSLAITLFLLVAGMEVDLSAVLRHPRTSLSISVPGMAVPFALGFGFAYAFPLLLGAESDSDRLIFALFVSTALSITALPVIAKILLDLVDPGKGDHRPHPAGGPGLHHLAQRGPRLRHHRRHPLRGLHRVDRDPLDVRGLPDAALPRPREADGVLCILGPDRVHRPTEQPFGAKSASSCGLPVPRGTMRRSCTGNAASS